MDFARGICEMIHYVQHDTIAVKKIIWVNIYIATLYIMLPICFYYVVWFLMIALILSCRIFLLVC